MSSAFAESVECIEGHNAGMPVKVVFLPHIPGKDMLERKKYCDENLDHIRRLLTYEPRSGSNSYGAVVTGSIDGESHFSAIYFDPSGWHDMCGHATMFLGSLAVQKNLIDFTGNGPIDVRIETPAGKVTVNVHLKESGEIDHVSLINVPSFILSNINAAISGYGKLNLPIIFGGDFYTMIDADALHIPYGRGQLPEYMRITKEILGSVKQDDIVHPLDPGLRGLYGVRYQTIAEGSSNRMHGILFFGNGERVSLDRSPSGTSSSAHLAYLYYVQKRIGVGEEVEFVSATGSVFKCKILEETRVADHPAIVPEISTTDRACFITGYANYVVDEEDPLLEGFKPLEPF